MDSGMRLFRRNGDTKLTMDLIIVLLVLLVVSVCCVGALWFLRRTRRARAAALLPMHKSHNEKLATPSKKSHRRLSGISISTSGPFSAKRRSSPKFVNDEKREFMAETLPSPLAGKVPQIRITFPEETDDTGKRQSGRSVLIHVDDKGCVGMEPIHDDEPLPPYEAGRFVSLDLDRMGGLKEKEQTQAKPQVAT